MNEVRIKIWKAAIYIRISKDNGEDTLEIQETIVRKHLCELGIQIHSVKVDDGYSGLNCNRPAFQEMLKEIERGEVNCVAVRDFSRFSRNHIDAGQYIQQIFPSQGVRFISVLEDMDFLTAPRQNELLMLGVKNIFNEAYIRNLSRSIQSSLQYGYEAGKYLGAFAPYGYLKSSADKYRLEPDPVTALVVEHIYQWKLEGMSAAAIAERLNKWAVPSPAEYKKSVSGVYNTGFQKNDLAKWTPIAVIRILSNHVYTGRLEQGKTQKLYFKAQKRTKKLESQWICTENAHKAIISLYQYEAVQRLLLMDTKCSPGEKMVAPLLGFVRCKRCGGTMAQKQNCCPKRKYFYYVCNGKNEQRIPCPAYRISKPILEREVFRQIKQRVEDVVQIDNMVQSLDITQLHRLKSREAADKIKTLMEELRLRRRCLDGLHDEIIIQTHSPSELESMRKHYMQECNRIEISIQKVEAKMQTPADTEELLGWIEKYRPYFAFETVTRPMLAYLVEKIVVGQDKMVEVKFIHERKYQLLKKTIE